MNFSKSTIPALYISYIAMPVVSAFVNSGLRTLVAIMVVIISISNVMVNTARLLPIYIPVFLSAFLSMYLAGELSYTTIYYYLNLFVVSLIGFHMLDNKQKLDSYTLSKLVLLMIAITCLTTTIGNIYFPGASRRLAGIGNDIAAFNLYMMFNIGGFDFVYMMVILFPLVVCMIRFLRSKFIGIVMAVLIAGVVLETGYGLATLFFLVSLILFFGKKEKGSEIIKRMLFLLILLLLVYEAVLPFLLNYVASVVPSEEVASRFRDLSNSITGSELEEGSDVQMRNDIYKMSIEGFLSSPIWGTLMFNSGGHSFVLDNMCIFGIIGVLLMIWMFRKVYYFFIAPFSKSYFYGYLLFSYILYIACLIANPQPYLFCVTLLYPVFTIYLTHKGVLLKSK